MTDAALDRMRKLIQRDVNRRGLDADPVANLFTACPEDFRNACLSVAKQPQPTLVILTGFFIPTGQPPSGETDGPLGAVFLARALLPLGIRVVIITDDFCAKAIQAGLNACGLRKDVPVAVLPTAEEAGGMSVSEYYRFFHDRVGSYTHLVALERVGPSHTSASLKEQHSSEEGLRLFQETVPPQHQDRCHSLRGQDVTSTMSPAHRLFETVATEPALTTIGIGDGGNEIGMGKIPWDTIRRNVPGGAKIACRVKAQHLIVCGISNWGAYGLAAGVRLLRKAMPEPELFHPEREFEILEAMIDAGPLVDGVTGLAEPTVDGLPFEEYSKILLELQAIS